MTDHPTPDVLPADRLRNLIDRACRHLTPAEANALRGALAGTMRNATAAVEGLQRWAADAEDDRDRARRWAVHLENENRRLKDQTKEAKEHARVATVAAYNLKRQTPDAAQRTLDRVRQARTWCDLWVQLGMYYGLKPEECGLEARERRATAERTAEARAERAEQQAAHVRAECETWKAKAEEIERDRDRIATEHTEFVLKAGEQIGRAQADTELLRRTVRAECDAIEREQYGQHDEDADGMREAARRIRAALDAAGQPDTSKEQQPRCVCGDPIVRMDHPDDPGWIHAPGSETRCLTARDARHAGHGSPCETHPDGSCAQPAPSR